MEDSMTAIDPFERPFLPDCMMPEGAEPCHAYRFVEKENATLAAEKERLESAWLEAEGKHSTEQHLREALAARVRSLEEALRDIVNTPWDYPEGPIRIAREALSDTPREEGSE
jgi:hypothetical protein